MVKDSKIEWTDHTFSPWLGCQKVSDGCKHCFAEGWAKRSGRVVWGPKGKRIRTSASYWRQPLKWNAEAAKAGVRAKVFCSSLADVFEDHPSIMPEWRTDLWMLIARTPHLDWLLLTKRPENFSVFDGWQRGYWDNVWLGVTAENQEEANRRLPILFMTPAVKRFVSVEPMLGPVNLNEAEAAGAIGYPLEGHGGLHWVICGSESGPKARPMKLDWVRSLRDQCVAYDTPFMFKQAIIDGKKTTLPELDGRVWAETPDHIPDAGKKVAP